MILHRIPGERFSRVEKEWEGETVALLGGGPSLTREQVEMVRAAGLRCIAVNDAYLWADFADVVYFADSHWWKWHAHGVYQNGNQALSFAKPRLGLTTEQIRERFASFAGQKCSIQNSGANIRDDAVHILRNSAFPGHSTGLSLDPCALVTGRNSGFQALNLAVLAGAKTILLLGYDGQRVNGKDHWHGGHPRPTPEAAYPHYRAAFSEAAKAIREAGVRVINCAPASAIETFEKMTLEDALACAGVAA